jgi:hypothetical protein
MGSPSYGLVVLAFAAAFLLLVARILPTLADLMVPPPLIGTR